MKKLSFLISACLLTSTIQADTVTELYKNSGKYKFEKSVSTNTTINNKVSVADILSEQNNALTAAAASASNSVKNTKKPNIRDRYIMQNYGHQPFDGNYSHPRGAFPQQLPTRTY